ncbi:MAG: YidC/Oxa1 family membrane protein insertase [Solirubrobacterales bacterium]|jgi:YidC/Oxa1 family membrane protein insertase|nr:YidC/Oxa1 family membrane protein insertase [Solirubrobacterales bacterium]
MVFANILQPLIDFFEAILRFFHDKGDLGWGTSIVALTLVVRAALLPLTLKQFKSMQAMGRLQPEIKALQAKYKDDRERLNQEMMKFYRENKVNPLASCLPIVAQLPVFLGLFYMLKKDLRLDICPSVNPIGTTNPVPCGSSNDSSFLFIPDLTNKATGAVLVALIVLYVGTQLVSSVMSTVSVDRNQRLLMLGLPFFFVVFIWNFPAGLLVYWITTNAWTIVQQLIVKKRLGPMRPPTPDKEQAGGFMGLGTLFSPKPASTGPAGTVAAGLATAERPKGRPSGPPPASPRKKKKRSGRRR